MALSLGGNKSKSSQSQNSTSATTYTPAFQATLDQQLAKLNNQSYQGLDPNAYKAYESPYQDEVIGAATNDINANYARDQTALKAAQAGNGAFGNDRRGISEAELAGSHERTLATTLAGLRQSGFTQAQGVAQQENANQSTFAAQTQAQIAQLLQLLAGGNQVTNSSGTAKGKASGLNFGFTYGGA